MTSSKLSVSASPAGYEMSSSTQSPPSSSRRPPVSTVIFSHVQSIAVRSPPPPRHRPPPPSPPPQEATRASSQTVVPAYSLSQNAPRNSTRPNSLARQSLGRRRSQNFEPVNLPSFTPMASPISATRSDSLPLELDPPPARPSTIGRSSQVPEPEEAIPRRAATLGRADFGSGCAKNINFILPSFTPGGNADVAPHEETPKQRILGDLFPAVAEVSAVKRLPPGPRVPPVTEVPPVTQPAAAAPSVSTATSIPVPPVAPSTNVTLPAVPAKKPNNSLAPLLRSSSGDIVPPYSTPSHPPPPSLSLDSPSPSSSSTPYQQKREETRPLPHPPSPPPKSPQNSSPPEPTPPSLPPSLPTMSPKNDDVAEGDSNSSKTFNSLLKSQPSSPPLAPSPTIPPAPAPATPPVPSPISAPVDAPSPAPAPALEGPPPPPAQPEQRGRFLPWGKKKSPKVSIKSGEGEAESDLVTTAETRGALTNVNESLGSEQEIHPPPILPTVLPTVLAGVGLEGGGAESRGGVEVSERVGGGGQAAEMEVGRNQTETSEILPRITPVLPLSAESIPPKSHPANEEWAPPADSVKGTTPSISADLGSGLGLGNEASKLQPVSGGEQEGAVERSTDSNLQHVETREGGNGVPESKDRTFLEAVEKEARMMQSLDGTGGELSWATGANDDVATKEWRAGFKVPQMPDTWRPSSIALKSLEPITGSPLMRTPSVGLGMVEIGEVYGHANPMEEPDPFSSPLSEAGAGAGAGVYERSLSGSSTRKSNPPPASIPPPPFLTPNPIEIPPLRLTRRFPPSGAGGGVGDGIGAGAGVKVAQWSAEENGSHNKGQGQGQAQGQGQGQVQGRMSALHKQVAASLPPLATPGSSSSSSPSPNPKPSLWSSVMGSLETLVEDTVAGMDVVWEEHVILWQTVTLNPTPRQRSLPKARKNWFSSLPNTPKSNSMPDRPIASFYGDTDGGGDGREASGRGVARNLRGGGAFLKPPGLKRNTSFS